VCVCVGVCVLFCVHCSGALYIPERGKSGLGADTEGQSTLDTTKRGELVSGA
jgi:hypothetical protein